MTLIGDHIIYENMHKMDGAHNSVIEIDFDSFKIRTP